MQVKKIAAIACTGAAILAFEKLSFIPIRVLFLSAMLWLVTGVLAYEMVFAATSGRFHGRSNAGPITRTATPAAFWLSAGLGLFLLPLMLYWSVTLMLRLLSPALPF